MLINYCLYSRLGIQSYSSTRSKDSRRREIGRPSPVFDAMGSILPLFLGILNYLAPNVLFRTSERSGRDLVYAAVDEEEL